MQSKFRTALHVCIDKSWGKVKLSSIVKQAEETLVQARKKSLVRVALVQARKKSLMHVA